MKVDAFAESESQYEAAGLVAFAHDWHIWRTNRGDQIVQIPGDWCATLRCGSTAGVSRTVMADTANQLADKLRQQAHVAKASC